MATVKKVSSKRSKSKSPPRAASAPARAADTTPKPAAPEKAEKAEKAAKTVKPVKTPKLPKRPKPLRDTFRMPAPEFDGLRTLKTRAKSLGVPAKKSEILRAGLRTLQRMDDEHFAVLLASVQSGP